MLVAAAVLPHPPILIPDMAAGAAAELDDVRAACAKALGVVTDVPHDRLVVVGSADAPGANQREKQVETFDAGDLGTMAGYGVPLEVRWPGRYSGRRDIVATDGTPVRTLPLSLTVAAWLVQQGARNGDVSGVAISQVEPAERAVALGRTLADSADRVVMVAMGDGSNALSTKAPGYLVAGAREWQDDLVAAIGSADLDALMALDAEVAARFGAAGRAPWQVLAGAASGSSAGDSSAGDSAWHAELLAVDEPYGVGYIVATWVRR